LPSYTGGKTQLIPYPNYASGSLCKARV
jgi:hypothetical protein